MRRRDGAARFVINIIIITTTITTTNLTTVVASLRFGTIEQMPWSPEPICRVVVIGVAGSGKTTIGERLAVELDAEFVDGDSLHSDANVAKMAAGTPLDDADRWPWLTRIRDVLRHHDRIVLACSGLRRDYRDRLREAGDVRFVYLDLDLATAEERTSSRSDHFMRTGMVASQFDTLERPTDDENDVASVDATADVDAVVQSSLTGLAAT